MSGRKLKRESEYGKTEYKLKIIGAEGDQLERLATRMKYRILEGGGEAIYEIGVSDDGQLIGLDEEELQETLRNIREAARKIGASYTVIREEAGRRGKVVEALIRRSRDGDFPVYLMIPALGQVDAGKSSTVGVLCSGDLDNGNGSAMNMIARYLHEIRMGRTSSSSSHLLGFDAHGKVVNYSISSPLDEAEIFLNSAKIISFVDLGGHERYLRTTLKGIMGHAPDYVMLVVGANAGVQPMTKEHVGVSVALRVPLFVVITKVDMIPARKLGYVMEEVFQLLKMPGVNKIPILVKRMDDVVVAAKNMESGRVTPVFLVSNTTGEGLDNLRAFLNLLPPRLQWDKQLEKPFLMYIDDIFRVRGVGVVVSGLILRGEASVDDLVRMGPFDDARFRQVRIKSIQVNRVNVDKVNAGHEACFAITDVEFAEIRKGMVLLDADIQPKAARTFKADMVVLYHPTTIMEGYEAAFHINTLRQTGRFVKLSKNALRSGDRASITVGFLHRPAYIEPGQQFIFREGRTRGLGTITSIP